MKIFSFLLHKIVSIQRRSLSKNIIAYEKFLSISASLWIEIILCGTLEISWWFVYGIL